MRPFRVLIAEPEADMQVLYRRFLNTLGLEVVIVEDSSKCLESVFNGGDAGFDMIILDAHLNNMSGLQVAKQIRARLPDQKIVITTTSLVEDLDRTEIGAASVITKPFSFSKLLAMIKPSIKN